MKNGILIMLMILTGLFVNAQDEDYSRNESDKYPNENTPDKRWHFGGGGYVSFGTVSSVVLSPQATYSITKRVLMGGSITYMYYKETDIYESSIYGGSIFNNVLVHENVFTHIEYEPLNVKYWNELKWDYDRTWIGSFFVGAGYRQSIGNSAFIQIALLYNLNYQTLTPYASPLVPRISILF